MPRPILRLAHPPPKPAPPLLPLSALVDQITVAEAEALFGINERWQEMKGKMLPGDELWWYCTVIESSTGKSSCHGGIALARTGKVIAKIGTRIFRATLKKG